MAKLEKWLCCSCEALLGFVEDKRWLRIKRQDLYVQVEKGNVSMPCYKCGKINHIEDYPKADLVDLKENNQRKEG